MAKRILRTPEAATYVGLRPATLERMRATGRGPRYLHLRGRAVGYDIQDLDSWLDERRLEQADDAPESRR